LPRAAALTPRRAHSDDTTARRGMRRGAQPTASELARRIPKQSISSP
jgi:hypothetical protein